MRRTIGLVLIIFLAGCSNAPVAPSPTTSPTPEQTSTAEPWPTVTFSSTPTPGPYLLNYWDDEELVIAVSTNVTTDRDYVSMVREASEYWDNHSERYSGYPMGFVVDPNASNPDVIVHITKSITRCGTEHSELVMGCAPKISQEVPPDRPEVVKIKVGYTTNTTVDTIKHEFGHLLGISHGEEPLSVMNASATSYRYYSRPNITERGYPWWERNLTVAIDDESLRNQPIEYDKTVSQVRHAVQYFQAGKSGIKPDNVSIQVTNNTSEADISITFEDGLEKDGSIGQAYGYSIDADESLEYRSTYEITITGLDEKAVGWHVGLWLSHALGVDNQAGLPEPFTNASYSERRGEWWR